MVYRPEPRPLKPSAGGAIRGVPAAILAAVTVYFFLSYVGSAAPWPELAGAIAGGFVLGRVTRR
jgi:hypothetical protein